MHHNRSCSGTERNEEAWQELMEASLRMGRGLGPIQNFRLNAERGTGEEAQPPGETQACSCRPQFRKKKIEITQGTIEEEMESRDGFSTRTHCTM